MRTDQAKAILLDTLLSVMGCQPERERKGELWYLSPLRPNETDASFVVSADRRAWYDHGRGEGGNILDFVMAYYSVNLKGALGQLDALMGGTTVPPLQTPPPPRLERQETRSAVTIERVQELSASALKRYLAVRGIPLWIARQWLQEIHFTLDEPRFAGKDFYALGFANQSGGWELRSRYYQGCTGKDITVTPAQGDSQELAVFEGFMDFLSARVYAGRPPSMGCIVLNSASMKQRALETMIRHPPAMVHLYLDNDPTGQGLVAYFQEELTKEGMTVQDHSSLYRDYKDFNEMLVAHKQSQARE